MHRGQGQRRIRRTAPRHDAVWQFRRRVRRESSTIKDLPFGEWETIPHFLFEKLPRLLLKVCALYDNIL